MQLHEEKPVIALACDHAGYELKETLKAYLAVKEYEIIDYGAHTMDPQDDYPDFVGPAAGFVSKRPLRRRAVVIGGSGEGEAIVANRFPHVRAVVVNTANPDIATLGRKHNDANVLALGARFLARGEVIAVVNSWLETRFEGGRHERRIEKIEQYNHTPYKIAAFVGWGVAFILGVVLYLLLQGI